MVALVLINYLFGDFMYPIFTRFLVIGGFLIFYFVDLLSEFEANHIKDAEIDLFIPW